MAIHSLAVVQALVREGKFALATARCRANVQSLGLTRSVQIRMLLAITQSDHRKEFGPADTDFGEILADAYSLHYDDDRQCRCRAGDGLAYYVKFGLAKSHDGELCAVASFHLSS